MGIKRWAVKKKLPGKFKGWFFLLRLHKIVPIHALNFLSHIAALSKWIQQHNRKDKTDFYTAKFNYFKREEMFERIVNEQALNQGIDYLEFGVSTGTSFRWWVNRIQHADARFYGFDTFTGLPEAWGPFHVGDMSNGNEPPQIDDTRHQFYQGLFQQTLLPFLANYDKSRRKVIHLDADIYSATLYVLTLITPYLKKGDILLFDEFNVPLHEFKAFTEWSKSFYIEYELIGAVNNYYQVAILLK